MDDIRLRLAKKSITETLKGITLKKFLLLTEPLKLELFNLFLLLKKGR